LSLSMIPSLSGTLNSRVEAIQRAKQQIAYTHVIIYLYLCTHL